SMLMRLPSTTGAVICGNAFRPRDHDDCAEIGCCQEPWRRGRHCMAGIALASAEPARHRCACAQHLWWAVDAKKGAATRSCHRAWRLGPLPARRALASSARALGGKENDATRAHIAVNRVRLASATLCGGVPAAHSPGSVVGANHDGGERRDAQASFK